MKRRLICALILLLLLPTLGDAEDAALYWTRNTDLYYHLNEHCADAQNMVPISESAALAFAKYACPICIPAQDDGAQAQAVSRGGTVVVRFSDSWLDARERVNTFGFMEEIPVSGKRAGYVLSESLHGKAYNTFLSDYMEDGRARARANSPYIIAQEGDVLMSRRHIGSEWYIVIRPQKRFGTSWSMYWRVESRELQMENDELNQNFDQQSVEEWQRLQLERLDGQSEAFSRHCMGFDIHVFDVLDGSIAVIREENAGAEQIENALLMIDGAPYGIALNGYMDGDAAIYCCALSEAERSALSHNVGVQLWHTQYLDGETFRMDMGEDHADYDLLSGEPLDVS